PSYLDPLTAAHHASPPPHHDTTSYFHPFFLYCSGHPRDLPSFPTRRSSDLISRTKTFTATSTCRPTCSSCFPRSRRLLAGMHSGDRKSTRLNSSHSQISYAVFCLKKKKKSRQKNKNK